MHFSETLGETRFVLVQRRTPAKNNTRTVKFIKSPTEFENDTVYMQRNMFNRPVLAHFLRKAGRNLTLVEDSRKNSVELLRMVAEGKIDYAICDENLAMVIKHAFPILDDETVITGFYNYGWAVAKPSASLLRQINEWITQIKKNKELKHTYLSYYDNPAIPGYYSNDYFSLRSRKISPFDDLIRKQSKVISWDWRLLASLIYEESNFHLGVISSRRASGLMQLMPETADKFGMNPNSSPAQQLAAGVKFLKWLDNQLSSGITDPKERISFILGAYNVGIGRVLAAREKAAKYGKDPSKWNNNVGYYLTRKSIKNPDPPDSADLSSPTGAGRFVEDILERYQDYRNNIPE
jgi:membrane-bound lytic murein transglycosylase F